jgi:hypothetical protein
MSLIPLDAARDLGSRVVITALAMSRASSLGG